MPAIVALSDAGAVSQSGRMHDHHAPVSQRNPSAVSEAAEHAQHGPGAGMLHAAILLSAGARGRAGRNRL
jgi:hypothetical protein